MNFNIFIRIYESAFCLQKMSYLSFGCVCVWRKDCYSILDRFYSNFESGIKINMNFIQIFIFIPVDSTWA